jgi:hypothetical protein
VKVSGNSYSTHFRQYDPRVGRWLSLDPAMSKYPNQSHFTVSADELNKMKCIEVEYSNILNFSGVITDQRIKKTN